MRKILLLIMLVCVFVFAVDSNAVVDRVYYQGGFQTLSPAISSENYQSITYDYASASGAYLLYAARADGTGVDRYLSGDALTWSKQFSLLTTTNYKEIETVDEFGNQFYAARADGTGLDRIYWHAGSFHTQSMLSTDYKALSLDPGSSGNLMMLYGARADGSGVDRIRSDNGGNNWYVDFPLLSTTDYDELSTVAATGNSFFANKADGSGLERVYYSGGWQTQSVVSGDFKALAHDPAQTGPLFLLYAAKADGTGVVRIRSDDWGSNWYNEMSVVSTDYDDLSMFANGVANQFYGSTIPEPMTVALLGLGGLLIRRRK